ncbi:glycerophosphodiester phosphodiesterase [Ranunculus cassubicifolius]
MATCRSLLLLFLIHSAVTALVFAQGSNRTRTSPWKTLSGAAPLVVAKGGFSGLFPDSSIMAYNMSLWTSLPNTVLWCDVQLTKDGVGVCLPSLVLDEHYRNIAGPSKVYTVNGEQTSGHFSVDYTLEDLDNQNVTVTRALRSRSVLFDGQKFPILTVEEMAQQTKPQALWLNIQHDAFFTQHNQSMRSYVLAVSRRVIVDYLSSPEVGFLRGILARFQASKTKLVFRFLEAERIEPSTNQTYGSLLKNLTFIKTFSSGILVPKNYIWPVTTEQYLLPHTTLVTDAHKEGLEVFASDFANDFPFSYNYSYDPVAEYLHFVDNGDFSVDGVLTDFPITPSEAIGCFSHVSPNSSAQAKPLIISHNGASGTFPDSTDLAFNQAVEDGADYIDCTVQMTSDGIPICLSSTNLIAVTNVVQSPFNGLAIIVPEIQKNPGIFTFNLTWKDIQSLKPVISSLARAYNMTRNPAYENAGSFLSLDDFLTFASAKSSLDGVLINIENAAYLATVRGVSITDAVTDALSKAGYNNQTTRNVIIQSTDKAVLTRFKEQTKYSRMYMVDKDIRSADDSSIKDIKSFADYVTVSKDSVYTERGFFLTASSFSNKKIITGSTNIISRLQSFNLTVFVHVFRNEFVEQAWDFFSDPIVEINSYVVGAEIDGIITEFPGTAARYRRNRCLSMGDNMPTYMSPVEPGSLLQLITPDLLPPAEAPYPLLTESDVAQGPLPPVSNIPPNRNSNVRLTAAIYFSSLLSLFLASILLL